MPIQYSLRLLDIYIRKQARARARFMKATPRHEKLSFFVRGRRGEGVAGYRSAAKTYRTYAECTIHNSTWGSLSWGLCTPSDLL
jgi:hypothetical protein